MKKAAIKKLNSTRGSGIAEALVGFLISVLSVITLLSIATTTLELIKQSDERLVFLYQDEGAMDQFINGNGADLEVGALYDSDNSGISLRISANGVIRGTETVSSANVKYYITNRHHLFGFIPNLS